MPISALRRARAVATRRTIRPEDVDDLASLDADAVCIALPSMKTAELLADSMPELARALKEIPYLGTISVNLIFDQKQIAHPLDGMGFVVPAIEGRALLACTFSSIKFPGRAPEGKVLLRAFLGGPERQNLLEHTDEKIGEIVMNDLAELLDISGSPDRFHVHRHPASMAQYHLGHLDRIARIESLLGKVPSRTASTARKRHQQSCCNSTSDRTARSGGLQAADSNNTLAQVCY